MRCFVCQGSENVSEMTDGRSSHTVCDGCRSMVTTFFHVYGSLGVAVMEAAQAKRGSSEAIIPRS